MGALWSESESMRDLGLIEAKGSAASGGGAPSAMKPGIPDRFGDGGGAMATLGGGAMATAVGGGATATLLDWAGLLFLLRPLISSYSLRIVRNASREVY